MRYLTIFILIAFTMDAHAAKPTDTAPDIANVIGTGQFSCGQFIEYRTQNKPEQLNVIVQWVWGFLSAYNMRGNFGTQWHRVSHIDSLPDSPTVLLFLETHCRKYPADTLVDGTFAFIKDQHGSVVWKVR